jgi:hypothetical protein
MIARCDTVSFKERHYNLHFDKLVAAQMLHAGVALTQTNDASDRNSNCRHYDLLAPL